MVNELLSNLGQQEILFLSIVLSVTVILIAQYIFRDSGEFGERTTSDLSPGELKQLVGQAVEEKVAPLQERIETLEEQQSRQLRSGSQRSLSDSGLSNQPDDRS